LLYALVINYFISEHLEAIMISMIMILAKN